MKKLFFYIAAILPSVALAQNSDNFTINSKVGSLNTPAKAYLIYKLGANNTVDSAAITNGSFKFNGQVIDPINALVVIDHKGVGISKLDGSADMLSLYLEKGTINVNSATDSIAKAQITGSPINDDNKRLTAELKSINDKARKLMTEAQTATAAQRSAPDFDNSLQTRLKAIQTEQETVLKNFIKANPKSYLSLLALSSLGGPSADASQLEPLYNGLSAELKETEAGKQLHTAIEGLKVTGIGTMAPDFTQNDIHGIPVKLSSFRGKYVLLDFWASWCGPCRQENPNVVKVYNRYKAKNFTILGVSLDRPDGKEAWLAAIKNDGLAWTQVSDLKFWNNEVANLYAVRAIPQNFLIDPKGKIIAKNLRGADLENKLAELLGKVN